MTRAMRHVIWRRRALAAAPAGWWVVCDEMRQGGATSSTTTKKNQIYDFFVSFRTYTPCRCGGPGGGPSGHIANGDTGIPVNVLDSSCPIWDVLNLISVYVETEKNTVQQKKN
jgi:hypothetical protein